MTEATTTPSPAAPRMPAPSPLLPHRHSIATLPLEGLEYALEQIFGPGPYLTDWAKAGPLIERHEVSLEFYPRRATHPKESPYWVARIDVDESYRRTERFVDVTNTVDGIGADPREAVARAILASMFGEHIWMPGDLPLSNRITAAPSATAGAAA